MSSHYTVRIVIEKVDKKDVPIADVNRRITYTQEELKNKNAGRAVETIANIVISDGGLVRLVGRAKKHLELVVDTDEA
jgi:hypothetical protein